MIEINFDKVLYRFPNRELAHVDIGIFYDERKNVIDKNQEFPKKEEEGANLFRRKREVAFRNNSLYNKTKRRSLRMRKYVIAQ